MNSMTGYGRAVGPLGNFTITAQISSVNRKTFDLTLALPHGWSSIESDITDLVRKVATRGKIHVAVEIHGNDPASTAAWDESAIHHTLDQLESLANTRGTPFAATPELLWQLALAHRKNGSTPDPDQCRESALDVIAEALRAFVAMRAREGEALLIDLLGRLETLHRHLLAIIERSPLVPAQYRENLLRRLRDASLELDLNDERVLKEIALFADRCDIAEEITRLRSHLDQFSAHLKSDSEIGRKAEFILQEIGREVHTIGSKANDLQLSRHVIELKNELERIREQIANVE